MPAVIFPPHAFTYEQAQSVRRCLLMKHCEIKELDSYDYAGGNR